MPRKLVKWEKVRELEHAGIEKVHRLFPDMLYGMNRKTAATGKKRGPAAW